MTLFKKKTVDDLTVDDLGEFLDAVNRQPTLPPLSTIKLCRDCRYYLEVTNGFSSVMSGPSQYCTETSVNLAHSNRAYYLVDAKPVALCSTARDTGPCGNEGNLWEVK